MFVVEGDGERMMSFFVKRLVRDSETDWFSREGKRESRRVRSGIEAEAP